MQEIKHFQGGHELDSLIVVQVLQGNYHYMGHCIQLYKIRSITDLLQHFDFSISHVYREANRAANCLANIGVKEQKFSFFLSKYPS